MPMYARENPSEATLYELGRQYGGFSHVIGRMNTVQKKPGVKRVRPCFIFRGPWTGYYFMNRRGGEAFQFILDYTRKHAPVRNPVIQEAFAELDHIYDTIVRYPLADWLP